MIPSRFCEALGGTKLLVAFIISLFKASSLRGSFGVAGNILIVIPGRVLYTLTPPGERSFHFFITNAPKTAATKMVSTTATPTQIAVAESPVEENEWNLIIYLRLPHTKVLVLRGFNAKTEKITGFTPLPSSASTFRCPIMYGQSYNFICLGLAHYFGFF